MLKTIQFNNKTINFQKPLVMGILNLTPDSFYDGGLYSGEKDILSKVEQMLGEGADIIDIGAVSTRPEANDVSLEDETKRLIPAIRKISQEFPDAILSIDTYRSVVAKQAIVAGAHIINDISGGVFDRSSHGWM